MVDFAPGATFYNELDQTLVVLTSKTGTATWRTSSKHNVVIFNSGPSHENMTLFTKPEVQGGEKSVRFLTNKLVYLGNGARYDHRCYKSRIKNHTQAME